MAGHVIAVLGLGAMCGAWVLVQQFFSRHDPEAPGVEGNHSCGSADSCATDGHCGSAASCATGGDCGQGHGHG